MLLACGTGAVTCVVSRTAAGSAVLWSAAERGGDAAEVVGHGGQTARAFNQPLVVLAPLVELHHNNMSSHHCISIHTLFIYYSISDHFTFTASVMTNPLRGYQHDDQPAARLPAR